MKEFSIEDTIIAYFDGRLTDSESAELLHRVSVSPEIREAFQEHEMLREISFRAARNVSVPPHLEDAVFTNLAALQQAERKAVPLGFWSARRIYSAAGAAIVLLLAGAIGGALWEGHSLNGALTSKVAVTENSVASVGPSSTVTSAPSVISASSEAEALHSVAPVQQSSTVVFSTDFASHAREHMRDVMNGEPIAAIPPSTSVSVPTEQLIAMSPTPRTTEGAGIILPEASGIPIKSLRDLAASEETSNFEIGLLSANPFSIPAAQMSFLPFTDWQLHVGYNLDENNQVGLRVRNGSFEHLESSTLASSGAYGELSGSLRPARMTSEEAYYQHSEPIAGGRAWIVAGVGAGFYSDGSLFSAGFGVKIPVADHLLAGFSVALSRLHQSGTTNDFFAGQSGPVIYTGAETRNTINGRLEYGLSYQF